MASEMTIKYPTGSTLYAIRTRASDGAWWDVAGGAYETAGTSAWGDYNTALAEQGSTGWYVGNDPDSGGSEGGYLVFLQAGGSPSSTDTLIGQGSLGFDRAAVNAEADTAISDAGLATGADLTTVDSVVDAIKAVTDNLPDSGALTSLLSSISSIFTATTMSMPSTLSDIEADTTAILDDTGTSGVVVGSLGANSVNASALASDAVTEIQSGLATAASIAALNDLAASDVWTYVTRTLTSSGALSQDDIDAIVAAITAAAAADSITNTGNNISRKRGDQWSIAITGMGDISDRSKLWFTVKTDSAHADAKAMIQVEETAQLIYINGGAASTAANATLTVDDENDGDITIVVKAVESAKIGPLTNALYDVQVLRDSGAVDTLRAATFTVTADVTRETS